MTGEAPLGALLEPLPGPPQPLFAEDIARRAQEVGVPAPEPVEALATVAAVSPYLCGLMLGQPDALADVLSRPLAQTVAEAAAVAPSSDTEAVARALRRAKARVALAVALADLCAGADVATVTRALSDTADAAVATALGTALLEAAERGAVDDPDPARSGLVVLGLGKLGAHELNYSSDIDLVALVDLARAAPRGIDQGRAVRLVQRMSRLLDERGPDGYVFRVDLRLRPDPASTPVAVSVRNAVRYFQSRARSWERQAMVKARQIAGDPGAGRAYLAAVEPSVWRTSYDFTVIEDTMAMREQIAMVRGAGEITVPGHNVKLGRGGIREIEFFVQSLQRLAGGRDRRLRGRGTVAMLAALARAGWIEEETRDALTEAYERLRRVEHRVQMVADEQTHALPAEDGLPAIARMMREEDFAPRIRATFETVHRHFLSLGDVVGRNSPQLAGLPSGGASLPEALAEAFDARFAAWQEGTLVALRTDRARRLLADIRDDLAAAVAAQADPPATLDALDRFLSSLPGGVDLLSRLELQRALIPVLVLIVSAAPRLAAELTRRAHLLDVLVDPAFFGHLPSEAALDEQLSAALAAAQDYEGRLDAMRVFGQEQALLVNVRILTGSLIGQEASAALTRLADVVVRHALAIAEEEFARRHGRVPGGSVAILAMGKFGGREMVATSDLDMVFLYEGEAESDGEKPLSPGHYFNRLAQRLVSALAAPTAKGMLYEVDLRLRPSGRAGPIATRITSFERYQDEAAWVWEHMAITRARFAAGDAALGARAMAAVDAALRRERDAEALALEVASMRRRMAEQSEAGLKHAPGCQVDVEFIAQFLTLRERLGAPGEAADTPSALRRAAEAGALSAGALSTLLGAHALYQRLSQLIAIASSKSIRIEETPVALQRLLVRAGEAPDLPFLLADLAERQKAVRALFEEIVAPIHAPIHAGAAPSGCEDEAED